VARTNLRFGEKNKRAFWASGTPSPRRSITNARPVATSQPYQSRKGVEKVEHQSFLSEVRKNPAALLRRKGTEKKEKERLAIGNEKKKRRFHLHEKSSQRKTNKERSGSRRTPQNGESKGGKKKAKRRDVPRSHWASLELVAESEDGDADDVESQVPR